jgi:hypothetical protein
MCEGLGWGWCSILVSTAVYSKIDPHPCGQVTFSCLPTAPPLRAFSAHARRDIRGPIWRQSLPQKPERSVAPLLRFCAQERAAVRVPCVAATGGRRGPQGERDGSRSPCCQHKEVLSAEPGRHSRTRSAGCAEGAAPGCPFSWSLFFGHAKRSDPLAREASGKGHGCLLRQRVTQSPNARAMRAYPAPS